MIATLKGELLHVSIDRLIVDVNGVGYDVAICQSGLKKLPEIGDEVFLHIYTKVREDAIELYGFVDLKDKEMFIILMGVSGVGPKLALNILSSVNCSVLALSIIKDDINSLTKLPGVGKKTAERLCLELKDKVHGFVKESSAGVPAKPEINIDKQLSEDVVSALGNLGYPQSQAQKALNSVIDSLPDNIPMPPIEEILRLTLRSLA